MKEGLTMADYSMLFCSILLRSDRVREEERYRKKQAERNRAILKWLI